MKVIALILIALSSFAWLQKCPACMPCVPLAMQPLHMQPIDIRRVKVKATISEKQCTACKHQEYVPQPEHVPMPLRHLNPHDSRKNQ